MMHTWLTFMVRPLAMPSGTVKVCSNTFWHGTKSSLVLGAVGWDFAVAL